MIFLEFEITLVRKIPKPNRNASNTMALPIRDSAVS